ncbi:inc metabolism membrane protein [Elasticomyces elasticus]|nr:inc metabolism membrane protein [Elasticomyces elasticus]
MACSAQSVTIESYPDSAVSSSVTPSEDTALLRDRRRRHSFDNARKNSCDYDGDAVFLRVELFLAELERRMHWIEQYRKSHMVQIDASLRRGYATLDEVNR